MNYDGIQGFFVLIKIDTGPQTSSRSSCKFHRFSKIINVSTSATLWFKQQFMHFQYKMCDKY